MNYYERHLGDYARDTAHLSILEHGVYTLLLDRYYATEQPIPADQAHRVARARSREEKAAVDAVLSEFFVLEAEGAYRNHRADEEIEKVQARITAAQENGRRGGRPKKSPMGAEEKPDGFSLGSKNETQQKALHTPDAKHQAPDLKACAPTTSGEVLLAGLLAAELNRASLRCTSHDPRLIEAANAGATVGEVLELRALYPDKPAAYLLRAAASQRADRATGATDHATRKPSRRLSAVERVTRNVQAARERDATLAVDGGVINGEAVRIVG